MRRKQLRSEHGFAMIEAVMAIGIVGLASLALLSVTFAMSSQARLSKDAINARLAAEQIAERASVYGCGLQTGAEVSSVIVAAKTRCNTALELGDGVILGDVSTSVTRKNVVYNLHMEEGFEETPKHLKNSFCHFYFRLQLKKTSCVKHATRMDPILSCLNLISFFCY